jgi:hypothetical protein
MGGVFIHVSCVSPTNTLRNRKKELLSWFSRHAVVKLVGALCYKPEGPDEVIGFFN